MWKRKLYSVAIKFLPLVAEIENLYIPKKCHEKRISLENMHTNMTNGGLTSYIKFI